MSVGLEILIIVLLIAANGALALAEMAVVAARKTLLEQQAGEGDARARAALDLLRTPTPFLATVQIGITLVGVLAGAFGGATLAHEIGMRLGAVPGMAPYGEAIGVTVVVLGITFLSLVFGELVPKQIALSNPEGFARRVARPLVLLARLARPVVYVLGASSDAVARLLGVRSAPNPAVTDDELRVIFRQSANSGALHAVEHDMLTGVLSLGDRRVSALLTPRLAIDWLDLDDSPEQLPAKLAACTHTRIPVVRAGQLDDVAGVVHVRDLLLQKLEGRPLDLRAALRPPLFLPENATALAAFERFKTQHEELALVVDEYGGVQGLVTIQDILEAVAGELPSSGPAEPEVVQRDDGSWLLDGQLAVTRFREIFDAGPLPGEEQGYYETLGGFVLWTLGRIPATGDVVEWRDLRIEVVDMDARRIDKLLVSRQGP